MCKHKFTLLRQSMIIRKGKATQILVYKCMHCNKLQIIDKDEGKIISLNGRMGTEI